MQTCNLTVLLPRCKSRQTSGEWKWPFYSEANIRYSPLPSHSWNACNSYIQIYWKVQHLLDHFQKTAHHISLMDKPNSCTSYDIWNTFIYCLFREHLLLYLAIGRICPSTKQNMWLSNHFAPRLWGVRFLVYTYPFTHPWKSRHFG